jgi:drug/metabolite transporter (DMT)-like permease
VVAFGVYFALLDRVGPTQLNLVGYLEPVAAALFGWLLLGDLVDAPTVAGFAAIFAGFALVKRRALGDLAGRAFASDDGGTAWAGEAGPADD